MRELKPAFIVLSGILTLLVSVVYADIEYPISSKTYLLMHFNQPGYLKILGQGKDATAKLFGDAKITEKGWMGACLNPGKTGGIVVQTDRLYAPQYGHTTIEARVYLEKYPEKRGYILEKVYKSKLDKVHNFKPEAASVGFSMFIDSKGRIGNEVTTIAYGSRHKRTFFYPKDYQVPLKKWLHIVIVNAGWPVGKYVVYVDGKTVHKNAHSFHQRIYVSSEKENVCGKVIIGNDAKHNAPFPGLIDEVRILGENFVPTPPADNSWVDVDAKKSLIKSSPYFLPETKSKVYVSFDEIDKIETVDSAAIKGKFKNGKLVPGVRGKAYSSGDVEIKGDGIINGKEGTIEFWMMPENWNNRTSRNVGLMSGGYQPYFQLYIFNSVSPLKALSLYFKNDEGKNVFTSVAKPILENHWYHVVMTWKNNHFKIYLNGEIGAEKSHLNINKMVNAIRKYIQLRGTPQSKGENKGKSTRFDEFYVYDTQLNEDEVHNAYWRYRDQSKLRKARYYDFTVKQYPSRDWVRINFDFPKGKQPDSLELVLRQNNKDVFRKKQKVNDLKPTITADTKKVDFGKYKMVLSIIGDQGKVMDRIAEELVKKKYPWLGNKLGVPTVPPEPWIPLVKNKTGVKCLLTNYDFGSGLIGQVTTDSGALLAAPVTFIGSVAGKKIDYKPKTKVSVTERGLNASIDQTFEINSLEIASKGNMDFDGFIKYEITLSATGESVTLDNLKLRIPYKADQALDFYIIGEHMDHMANTVPAKNGSFWNSLNGKIYRRHEVPEYGAMKKARKGLKYGNFYPYSWAGNNHRGLCFMANNDQGWVQNDTVPAIDFIRADKAVYMDLNLVAEPVKIIKGHPRKIVLSLMATPSKRPAKGWRHWHTSSFYPTEQSGRALDASIFYVPYPVDYEKSAKYIKGLRKQLIVPLPYMDFYGSDGRMAPAEDFRWEWWPDISMKKFPKKSQIYRTYYGSGSIIDWYIFKLNEWIDRCDVNGVYVDNHYPAPLMSTVFGPAYVHDKGGTQAGYQLFAMREFFKRIYCLLAAKGKKHPYLMVHMTHCQLAPSMSFADIAYEGEDHYINGERKKQEREGADHITYWPNNIVRIIDLPHAYGVATHWLGAVHGRKEKWVLPHSRQYYIRAWYTQLLLHDMVGGISRDGGLRKVFNDFLAEDPEVEFVLYRDNKSIVPLNGNKVFISYYKRGKEVLAAIGNQSSKKQTINVSVNPAGLGLKNVEYVNAETGKSLKKSDRGFAITVTPRDYRLVLIKEQGKK